MPKKEPSEFDINKVTAEFVQKNIENFVKLGTDVFKTAAQKVQHHLDRTYKAYLKYVADKCSHTKSFFIRGEPAYLYQFYVPLPASTAVPRAEGG
jgi:hypothetical protein